MILRRRLLKKLKVLTPAVCDHDMDPRLTHFCFTGEQVLARNDWIAISTPLRTTFKGCIPATALVNALKVSRATAIDLQRDGDMVQVRLCNACMRLPMMCVANFPFHMPPPPTQNCIRGVEHCLHWVSNVSLVPHFGVTLIPKRGKIKLYSTDGTTLTHCTVMSDGLRLDRRINLPTYFCKQMLRLAKQATTSRLAVHGEGVLFAADDTLLFTPLVQCSGEVRCYLNGKFVGYKPIDFEGTLKRYLPKHFQQSMVKMRKRELTHILRWATLVCNIRGNEARTKITVRDGEATFYSCSRRGECTGTTRLPGHPDTDLEVRSDLLLKAYPTFDKVLLTPKCVIMTKGDDMHLIAAYSR
jgi:hypothetical protein